MMTHTWHILQQIHLAHKGKVGPSLRIVRLVSCVCMCVFVLQIKAGEIKLRLPVIIGTIPAFQQTVREPSQALQSQPGVSRTFLVHSQGSLRTILNIRSD